MADNDVKMYDVNQGFGRDGGPYMDEVDRRQAEVNRARVEGREPDLDNPPPIAGTQLVDAATLVDQYNPASHPSMDSGAALAAAVDLAADDPDHPLQSVAAIPAEVATTQSSNQQLANEGASEYKSAGGETIGEYGTVTGEALGGENGEPVVSDNLGDNDAQPSDNEHPVSDSGSTVVTDSGTSGSETVTQVEAPAAVSAPGESFPDAPNTPTE